ncbi:diaminopimelate decarboxylase [bacterium]|nr:diaminopimelate decarboxylase [bacterium]
MSANSPQGFFLDHACISFSAEGELQLSGRPVSELLAEFGSPLVVMLENVIRANCREFRKRLEIYPRSRVYFASKAFMCKGMCRLLQQEGLGIDVVSSGELYTALSAGMDPQQITLHGNAKSPDEIEMAVNSRIGRIAIDKLDEIQLIAEAARRQGLRQKVLLRVSPGVKPSTHEYVQTGQEDSKFGFNLADGAALEAARSIHAQPDLELVGIHCHIGSQILDGGPFRVAARAMLEFYALVQREIGAPLDELNLGGGLGIRYQPEQHPPLIAQHYEVLCDTIISICRELEIEPPVLCDEPGRSIVGEAGITLYTARSIKKIPGVRNYVGVDGGMTDNPRFALYSARHYAINASRGGWQQTQAAAKLPDNEGLWSIAGKCCETGDMLLRDQPMAEPKAGDIIAMFCTGAYTYSMASNYNRVPRPAVVLSGDNGQAVLIRRETPEDVAERDMLPAWLA